ncbi:MAG: hypothetical protein KC910_19585 [Candidatus Eremiobacteraeota bacterium]|nr:hypothetical protein [Candidatus Eremiobacteraeota bacterium]
MAVWHWMTVGDARRCERLPDWLHQLLRGRPDDEEMSQVYRAVRRHQDQAGWAWLDGLTGVGANLLIPIAFTGLTVASWGGWAYVAGALAALGSYDDVVEAWADLSAARVRPAQLEDWLQTIGPPWLEERPYGQLSRLFPTSTAMPRREARLVDGQAVSRLVEFKGVTFSQTGPRMRVERGQERFEFEAVFVDFEGFDVSLTTQDPRFLLELTREGQAHLIASEGSSDPLAEPSLFALTSSALPFPLEWLS